MIAEVRHICNVMAFFKRFVKSTNVWRSGVIHPSRTGKVFSEYILKIEICGPDEDYLTVIYVLGIFRSPTEGFGRPKLQAGRSSEASTGDLGVQQLKGIACDNRDF